MMLSKHASTPETKNFSLLARIILGPCADVLRDILIKEMHPSMLSNYVKTKNQKKNHLTYSGDVSKFDISLLYNLLRNKCSIPEHTQKWGNYPSEGDRTVSANIERIRFMRNKYFGHATNSSIPHDEFEKIWKKLFQVVKELESHLGTSRSHQDAITFLRLSSIDPELEKNFIQKLVNRDELQESFENMKDEIKDMKKKTVPWNVEEIHKKGIQNWKEDDKVFYETHNFPAMLLKVKQRPFVTFVGVPGSGKTATARHIALLLEKEGYAILPITDKSEIKTYCDPCNLQVFVIDDVIGMYKFDSRELDVLRRYKEIVNAVMPKTKILMTCRETVFRHKKLSKIFLTKQENVILLHSEENALNDQDKRELLAKYQIDPNVWKSGNLASSSYMFPFLCKLFSKEEKYKVYGPSFFISPVPCILKELDKMKTNNEIQYVSLMLLMANQNKLTEDMFSEYDSKQQSDFNEMKRKFLQICEVPFDTYGYQFINALSEMEKTYTNKCGKEITFINDSLFEITACHFGRQFPELILQYMRCDFIANNIKVDTRENGAFIKSEKENMNDLCIWLQEEEHHKLLAERLAKDVENDELHSVFKNEAMKHSTVLRAFIEVMEKMKFAKLYSIFLSKRKSESQEKYGFNPRVHLLNQVSDNTDLNDHIATVRAITWIIYYGHHEILQYIIDQCLKEEKEVDELYQSSNRYVFRNYEMMKERDTIIQLETSNPDTMEEFILLCIGCYSGCLNTVQILLKYLNKYAILNARNLGSTPLVIACKLGYSEIANELVKAGANINLDDTQVSPLLETCQKGHLCVVETLIRLGANVNLCFDFRTPLTVACQGGYFEIVKKLIQSGADVNPDNKVHTPLTTACEHGHARIVEELIRANSNVDLNGKFHTPLTAACQNGHVDVVEKLIKAGASVNLKYESTPLNIAVKIGHSSIVDKLLNAKADVNYSDGKQTPLIVACEKGCLNLVKELIKTGADVNLNCALCTPLTAACKYDPCTDDMRLHVVQELLNRGADVNLIDGNRTPLTAACVNGYLDIVEKLIKAGARVNQQDKTQTPLTTACWNGHLGVVKYLIKQRADVNLKDETRTPLTASCKRGHVGVVEELIKAKAKVNLSDGEWTPMTAASSKIVTEILLNAGAVLSKCQKL